MPIRRASDPETTRTESLLSLILELYRAAQETPVEEFEHLALAMARALLPADDLASHIANAIRINRALCPGSADLLNIRSI